MTGGLSGGGREPAARREQPDAGETAAPPLCGAQFEGLRGFAGASAEGARAVADVVRIFLESGRQGLGSMQDAMAARDWQQVARLAHKLRGSAATLGAQALAAACAAVEEVADREGPGAGVERLAAAVRGRFEEAEAALLRQFPGASAEPGAPPEDA